MKEYYQKYYEDSEMPLALILFDDIQKNFESYALKNKGAFGAAFALFNRLCELITGMEMPIPFLQELRKTIPAHTKFMVEWTDKKGELHTEDEPLRMLICSLLKAHDAYEQEDIKAYVLLTIAGIRADSRLNEICQSITRERDSKIEIHIKAAGFLN